MVLRVPLVIGSDGLRQQLQPGDTFPAPLRFANQQLGQIVTNTAAEVAFVFQSAIVFPTNTLKAGCCLRISQRGVYQSGLSQSIQPRIRLGPSTTALTSRTVLTTTNGAVSGLLNAAADTPWAADTTHILLPDGTFISSGCLFFSTGATAALTALVATATPVSGVDLTADNVLTASVQWTGAQTANQIRATTFLVELLQF